MTGLSSSEIAQRLEKLTELSLELSNNHDTPLLLENILRSAKSITYADGGTLYRTSKDKQSLCFNISLNDTLNMYQGGVKGQTVDIPNIPLTDSYGNKNLNAVAAYAANYKLSVNIQDVYTVGVFNFSGTRNFDQQFHYKTKSLLTVPMHDHEGELIGVLQLINATDPETGEHRAFSETDQRFIEALASQAAIALTNQQLISQLENLFVSLVHLINIGIDEKSPHTGRHCQHVPELTMLLANAVHETDQGPLADFSMTDKDRKELWMAGILHDCGKISTPVHVVEKSTKLETIFDRIHLLDTRFEVLKRDAEIKFLKSKCALYSSSVYNEDLIAELEQDLKKDLEKIDDAKNFLRKLNIGAERTSPEDLQRVTEIAAWHWTDVDGEVRPFLNADEVENLSVRAGTLNAEERTIINNHISTTIKMLEALPWPKHLQNVPEYAGGHHERMDGKGYPRGLRGEQMSVQAKIMAIADIFEALTAKDRPYKDGKTLTESLRILGNFSLNGHIDPDLFDIFVRKKVYLTYAERFMDKAQIDEVDLGQIPGYHI
ncbi:HD family phosphohydrolase [Undibacterium sp. TS12]|uniref:GAF and HD-GYP domain-containing protein n=1 Tax=Undibacterium sp. TS12 TaxID=2908202 RepID=UPI001F4CF5AA|nr:HD family phosphohydrolase [Undibacterium sp. TS12]MCH8620016.1 GAF domain-containing protein [Undibacterium sp. TS12]